MGRARLQKAKALLCHMFIVPIVLIILFVTWLIFIMLSYVYSMGDPEGDPTWLGELKRRECMIKITGVGTAVMTAPTQATAPLSTGQSGTVRTCTLARSFNSPIAAYSEQTKYSYNNDGYYISSDRVRQSRNVRGIRDSFVACLRLTATRHELHA